MQGKGVVRFFLVVMTIVTIVQYLFLLPTQRVEKAADEYAESLASQAQEDQQRTVFKEKRSEFLDSMSTVEVFKIPYLKTYTYQELKAQQLALGLDLKGGMSVVLQVDLRDFIRALANDSKDPTFLEALDQATEAQKNAQSDYVTLFADAFTSNDKGQKLAPIFARNEALREKINFETSDGEVVRLIREKANETVDLTYKLLKERIDKLGVTQPNVSLDVGRDLITVELPGIDNPERARSFLQAAAKLEFWNVYRINDNGILSAFSQANDRLAKKMDYTLEPEVLSIDTTYATDSLGNAIESEIVAIDTTFSPFNANQGPLFDALTLNQTGARGLAVMGTAPKNQRNKINELLNQEGISSLFPRDLRFHWSKDPIKDLETNETTDEYELYAIKVERGSNNAPLTGDRVVDASANPDPQTNDVVVSLKMDNAGAKIWGQLTTKAAQDNNREIAILLDDEVVSAPRVINPILSVIHRSPVPLHCRKRKTYRISFR
jgi:SecD/SecF fusion protein